MKEWLKSYWLPLMCFLVAIAMVIVVQMGYTSGKENEKLKERKNIDMFSDFKTNDTTTDVKKTNDITTEVRKREKSDIQSKYIRL